MSRILYSALPFPYSPEKLSRPRGRELYLGPGTRGAIEFADAIKELIVIHNRPSCDQGFAIGQNVNIQAFIVPEVDTRECTIAAVRFLEDRDMWRNALFIDRPVERGSGTIGTFGGQPFGL